MLGELLVAKERRSWRDVPDLAVSLAVQCKAAADDVRYISQQRPGELIDAWLHPEYGVLTLNLTKRGEIAAWEDCFCDLPHFSALRASTGLDNYHLPYEVENPQWNQAVVKIAMRPYAAVAAQEKQAYSPNLRKLLAFTGWKPDLLNTPNWPSPAAAMLATGLLGAGAGYGVGMLGEHLLPGSWNREHRLRHTLAAAGGLAGALPGAWWAASNVANDHGITENWPQEPEMPKEAEAGYPWWETPVQHVEGSGDENHTQIDVPQFQQIIWHDPYVSQQLSPQIQAMATGLVGGAAHLAGGDGPATMISPWDIGAMTAGMGKGYVAGALIGKALGTLMGMPEEEQAQLRQTGLWAGAIRTLIPRAFGEA